MWGSGGMKRIVMAARMQGDGPAVVKSVKRIGWRRTDERSTCIATASISKPSTHSAAIFTRDALVRMQRFGMARNSKQFDIKVPRPLLVHRASTTPASCNGPVVARRESSGEVVGELLCQHTKSSVTAMAILVPSAVEPAATNAETAAMSIMSYMPDLPAPFYEMLMTMHSTTGLGWAGTIVLCTVLMRASLFPLTVFADRNSRKFAAKVTPAMFKLYKDLSPVDTLGRPRKFESSAEFWKLQRIFLTGTRTLWMRHKCSPLKTLASPLVQLPVFVSMSVALRRLVGKTALLAEFESQGALWFPDLTVAAFNGFLKINENHPEAIILPLMTTSLVMLNAHLAFGDKLPLLKRIVTLLPLVALPLSYQLPQALFCYWGTSFALTTLQIFGQRTRFYQRLVAAETESTLATGKGVKVELLPEKEDEARSSTAPAAQALARGGEAGHALGEASDTSQSNEGLEDLNERLADAQRRFKDKPEELKKAQIEVLLQRMTYERQYILPALLQEVCDGSQAVDDAACRRVEGAIAHARSTGSIVALPPVVAQVEEVPDLGKGDGQGGKRIKLVFPGT